MGALHAFVGGGWKKAKNAYCFVGGGWKKAKAVWVFVGGTWKQMGFGTTFSFDIGQNDRGVLGFSTDSRLRLTGGGIFPNPVPEIGKITDFWWQADQGWEYGFGVEGIPDGTELTLSIDVSSTRTVSGKICVGGDNGQTMGELGESMQYLMNTYISPATLRVTLSL